MAEAVVRANAVQNCADGISWMSRGRTPNGLPLDQIPIRQRAALSLLAGCCHRAGPIDAPPLQTPAMEAPDHGAPRLRKSGRRIDGSNAMTASESADRADL